MIAALLVGCGNEPTSEGNDENLSVVFVNSEVEDVPAIDFCVRSDVGWIGPVVQFWGLADGLAPDNRIGPFSVAAGEYEVRMVDSTINACFPSLNDADTFITVPPGENEALVTGNVFPEAGEPGITVTITPI